LSNTMMRSTHFWSTTSLLSLLLFRSTLGWAPERNLSLRSWKTHPQIRQACLLSMSSSDEEASSSDDFMASLRTRIGEVSDRESKLPIVVLDTMLPRQVLRIEAKEEAFIDLVRHLLEDENPCFGMIGMAQTDTGQTYPLKAGVEVQITGKPELVDTGLRVELVANRRMVIEGEIGTNPKGWTEARVKFLDFAQEEQDEETNVPTASSGSSSNSNYDRFSLARAMAKSREFSSPNVNMKDNLSLVDRWVQLARENERRPGQIDKLLKDLGDIPPSEEPSDRSFWVGALINPLPGMGVAMEIRPALLVAQTAEERVEIALNGILTSIKHMDGSDPMW